MSNKELRMNAYYYNFTPTGDHDVDRILSAVAHAGKAFHHTSQWVDDAYDDPPEGLAGITPVDWIQNAANAAARVELLDAEDSDLVQVVATAYAGLTSRDLLGGF